MIMFYKVFLFVLVAALLAGCGRPSPVTPAATPTPTKPQVTLPPEGTLPSDAWFSIRAKGRASPTLSDVVIVYPNGLAVYTDPKAGKQYQKQLSADTFARWQRIISSQTCFMPLKDSYPATTPGPEDSIYYTVFCRQDGKVKTVTAQMSGAPPQLQATLREFWKFIQEIQAVS